MTLISIVITAVPLMTAVGIVVYTLRNFQRLRPSSGDSFPIDVGETINVHELGELEGAIENLVKVIIAAHRIERPTNALLLAVELNMERGVEYQFLISKSNADKEVSGYYQMWDAIAKIVDSRRNTGLAPMRGIQKLGFDWRDTPYIFYQATLAEDGRLATVAFRGDQPGEGIAENYTRISTEIAYSMALALLSDAPQPLEVSPAEFVAAPVVKKNE